MPLKQLILRIQELALHRVLANQNCVKVCARSVGAPTQSSEQIRAHRAATRAGRLEADARRLIASDARGQSISPHEMRLRSKTRPCI